MIFNKALCGFIFFCFLSVCLLEVKAQDALVSYQLTINDKILGKKRTQNLILYIHNATSVERIIKPVKLSDVGEQSTELNDIKLIETKRPYFIFKDILKKRLVLSDYIAAKKYLVNDTVNNFRWKISSEKAKLMGFNCRKAVVSFRGRNYVAWYAEQIPIQNGPWKFCGLPGLIVKVYDTKADFVYELNGIDLKAKFASSIISIPAEYQKDKAISHKEFISLYRQKLDDNFKLARIEQVAPTGERGMIQINLPEKQEKF